MNNNHDKIMIAFNDIWQSVKVICFVGGGSTLIASIALFTVLLVLKTKHSK